MKAIHPLQLLQLASIDVLFSLYFLFLSYEILNLKFAILFFIILLAGILINVFLTLYSNNFFTLRKPKFIIKAHSIN